MAWECAECNASEIKSVCHHCGKPLCTGDQVEIDDDAFSDEEGRISRRAMHCKACKEKHHPRAVQLNQVR
ncbi:hypothetical protein [Lentzea sp. E54]|uniref:hypothetical protein n=1 Tax=Lentzea xerophila TaxID=3435883 RepID=UPI003DA27975